MVRRSYNQVAPFFSDIKGAQSNAVPQVHLSTSGSLDTGVVLCTGTAIALLLSSRASKVGHSLLTPTGVVRVEKKVTCLFALVIKQSSFEQVCAWNKFNDIFYQFDLERTAY